MLDDFPGGVWSVDLAPVSDLALVIERVASAVGVRLPAGGSGVEPLLGHLSGDPVLLVLDNSEHLVDEIARLTHEVLRGTTALRVLATSREPLRVDGEQVFAIPELEVGDPSGVGGEASSPAVELFVDRARHAVSDLALGGTDLRAVAEICRKLDGLPLAIELAAARVAVFTPQQIAERLDEALRLLTGGRRDEPAHHQSLEAAIAWSYELLDKDERRLFARLAAFPATFDLHAAEAICGGDDGLDVLDLLPRLVAKSLVVVTSPRPGTRRYRLLDTVRAYASARLAEAGAVEDLHARHAEHFLAMAEVAEPALRTAKNADWIDKLRTEYDNLRAALEWSTASGHDDLALRLAGALRTYWIDVSDVREGRRWLEAVIDLGERASTPARAKALMGAANFAGLAGDDTRDLAWMEEAVALYRRLVETGESSEHDLGRAVHNLGTVHLARRDWASARRCYVESLDIDRRAGSVWGEAIPFGNLALVVAEEGDLDQARELAEEGVAVSFDLGAPLRISDAYCSVQQIALLAGDHESALTALERCIEYGEGIRPPYVAAFLGCRLASIHLMAGDLETAVAIFSQHAGAAFQDASLLSYGMAAAEVGLCRVGIALARGAPEEAATALGVTDRMAETGKTIELSTYYKAVEADYRRSARESLGPDRLAEMLRRGRAMSEDEATALITSPIVSAPA
jgi:predicted ATPase